MPTISVIVPVYKAEKYIHRCVDSILAQTFTDFELILVDDGSPDNCPVICDEYAAKDCRVRVIHQENGGVSRARNMGLRCANGEYITFVDSDDYIDAAFLSEAMADARSSCLDLYIAGHRQIGDGGYRKDFVVAQDIEKHTIDLTEGEAVDLLANNYIASSCGKVIKKAFIGDIEFDPRMNFGEDLKFMHQLLNSHGIVKAVARARYYHCVEYKEGTNLTAQVDEEKCRSVAETYRILLAKEYCSDGINEYRNFVEKRWLEDLLIVQNMILNSDVSVNRKYTLLKLLLSEPDQVAICKKNECKYVRVYASNPALLIARKMTGRMIRALFRSA